MALYLTFLLCLIIYNSDLPHELSKSLTCMVTECAFSNPEVE